MKKKACRSAALVMAVILSVNMPGATGVAVQNGFVKSGNNWYYYTSGEKATGLKKISGKYYIFDKSGVMQSGYKKYKGIMYNLKAGSDGKAPAATNTSGEYGGKKYYFSGKGKGFFTMGSDAGNKAVATVYDRTKVSGGKKKKIEKLYRNILSVCSYLGVGAPDLSSSEWITTCASDMNSRKKGNCYNYAAIIGLLAKSVGYSTQVLTGKCKRGEDAKSTEHAWVIVGGSSILDGVFEDNGYTGGSLSFFFKTYNDLKNSKGYTYIVEKKYGI